MTTTNVLESFFPELRSELATVPESEAILKQKRKIAELEENSRASQLAAQMAEKKLNQIAAANSKKRARDKSSSLSSSTTISSSEDDDSDLEKSESIGDSDGDDEEAEDEEEEDDGDDISTDESQQEREFKENKKLMEKAKKKKLLKTQTKKPKKSTPPVRVPSSSPPLLNKEQQKATALFETLMGQEEEEAPPIEPIQEKEDKLKELLETVRNTIQHEENLQQLNNALKKSIEEKLEALRLKEAEISDRENAIEEKLKELKKKETDFTWKESLQNEGREKEIQLREKALSDKEKEIKEKEQHFEKLALDKNRAITKHDETVKKFEAKRSELANKEKELKDAQEKYAKESKELRDARFAFNEKETGLKHKENNWDIVRSVIENDRLVLNLHAEDLKRRELELSNQVKELATFVAQKSESTGIIDKIVANTIEKNAKDFNSILFSMLTESQQRQYLPGFFNDKLILNTSNTPEYEVTLIRNKETMSLAFLQMRTTTTFF